MPGLLQTLSGINKPRLHKKPRRRCSRGAFPLITLKRGLIYETNHRYKQDIFYCNVMVTVLSAGAVSVQIEPKAIPRSVLTPITV